MSVAEATLGPLDESKPAGPGPRLREAREAVGLSVRDIAARLRLDPKVITALESEEFDKLHGPTFVRGYLRGYARALDLPPAPIMEAYDRRGEQLPALVRDITTGNVEVRSSDPPVRLATWAIVAVSVGLVVLWWQNQGAVPQMSEGAEQVAVIETEIAPVEPPVMSEQAPVVEVAADPVVPVPAPQLPLVTEEPVVQAAPEIAVTMLDGGEGSVGVVHQPTPPSAAPVVAEVEISDAVSSAPAPVVVAEQDITAAEVEQPPEAVSQTEVASEQEPPTTASSADGAEHLTMRFEHESWVEVYGVGGRRLYYNLVKPGQTLDLDGQAPIKVLLGYARGVRVQYNGRFFDHKPFMSKGLARFTLGGGAADSNQPPEG